MIFVIIACEIGFWAILAIGFSCRYLLHLRRTSTVILSSIFIVDTILIIVSMIQVRNGAKATWSSAIAPFYLGFSSIWGHRTVVWCDRYLLHKLHGEKHPREYLPTDTKQLRIRYFKDMLKDQCAIFIAITLSQLCIMVGGGLSELTLAFAAGQRAAIFMGFILFLIDGGYVIWPKWKTTKEKEKKQSDEPDEKLALMERKTAVALKIRGLSGDLAKVADRQERYLVLQAMLESDEYGASEDIARNAAERILRYRSRT